MTVLVEACVDSVAAAAAAERAGAGRLELCATLDVGGTTPSSELVRAVRAAAGIPVFVMVRPRGGDFVYDERERRSMLTDIAAAREAGADGIVIGALMPEGRLDLDTIERLVDAAGLLPVTFHKAFDAVADQCAGLEQLIDRGVQRILTSGGRRTAAEGCPSLAALVRQARGRLTIMPGGGVRAPNVRAIVQATGALEVHARAGEDGGAIRALVEVLGSLKPAW